MRKMSKTEAKAWAEDAAQFVDFMKGAHRLKSCVKCDGSRPCPRHEEMNSGGVCTDDCPACSTQQAGDK
jgi:hypothetical protein